jgi:hypothetical protein
MPLDHYLPATFLASFSSQICQPRRQSLLVVGDVWKKQEPRWDKAENLAAKNNFYTIDNRDPRIIDKIWLGYESAFDGAVNALIEGNITALAWARTLVPFVAAMLVRGPDFNARYENRSFVRDYAQNHKLSVDNTNGARVIELQRLLGPIAAAQWVVSYLEGDEQLITNDVGFAASQNIDTGELGLAIPLDLNHVLTVVPRKKSVIALDQDGIWYPNIKHTSIKAGNENALNNAIVAGAQRFIFGSNKELIARLVLERQDIHSSRGTPEPGEIGFLTGSDARVHEFTWHRLISFLVKSNDDTSASFAVDWEALAKGWCPPIYLPTNLPEFPSSLYRKGDEICAYLYSGEWAMSQFHFEPSAEYHSYKVVC